MHYLLGYFQDFGASFHGHHHHYRFCDGDELYHRSRHRLVYTSTGTELRPGIARDGAGQHSRLPEDRYVWPYSC
ncbi:hypothetical protein E2562_021361 [Oryza meyeriana var. granulata]|uniref:Uncharacterized protein n=1 Tax=Oryza meyeriana var. granulata TaxID=110450 RepID=A0A6G1CHJ3_9ORYZ|nr:hypothetical protein E2562_021361 [Oryza meyeriana var. granulata]